MDWQRIGEGLAELADKGLAMDWQRIGFGLALDWLQIGNGLPPDR